MLKESLRKPQKEIPVKLTNSENTKATTLECKIIVNGFKVPVTIDSGAAASIVSQTAMDQLGFEIEEATNKRIVTANDVAIFAWLREKAGHKIGVILNLSDQPQRFTISDKSIYGNPLNIFLGVKEKLSREHVYSIEPWGYIVYDYDR